MNPIRIPDIKNYTIEIIDDTLILTPKIITPVNTPISKKELSKLSITNSRILSCIIYNSESQIITKKTKYQSILIDLWKFIGRDIILKNSTYDIKTDNNIDSPYIYNSELEFAFKSKNAKNTMKEIIHMCEINELKLEIEIELENKKKIIFLI
jgi:adenylate cyclase